MAEDEEHFTNALSSPHVSGKNTVGIWKGCFGSFRKMCMKITKNPRSLKILLEIIDAAVILHNVLILVNDNTNTVDAETWLRELDDKFSNMNNVVQCPEEEVLRRLMPRGAPEGTTHEQLKVLIHKTCVRTYNYVAGRHSNGDSWSLPSNDSTRKN
jgi:hypothetical protein